MPPALAADLGLKGAALNIEDQFGPETWQVPFEKGRSAVEMPIPKEQVRVLRLSAK